MTVVERESLMASALASASCSLGHDVELVRERPLPSVDEAGSEASCEYLVRVADWPEGELECVLEYRVSTIRAVRATTFGFGLALRYYGWRRGGIYRFSGDEDGRSFLMVDSRWCKCFGAGFGLEAVR